MRLVAAQADRRLTLGAYCKEIQMADQTPTPPPSAAPAASPASSGDAPPAWAQALIAKVESLEGVKVKLEADLSAKSQALEETSKSKLTLEEKFAASERERTADKIDSALMREFGKKSYTHAEAQEHALQVFRATHRVEQRDGATIVIGSDGRPQHLKEAAEGWLKTKGAMYLAAPAQPGAGTPGAASPDTGVKSWRSMSPAERATMLENGVRVRMTADARSPIVTIKKRESAFQRYNKGGAS